MARDIRERGQLEPIVLYQEQILDGPCRYRGCLLAEVVPKVEKYEGGNPVGYVISRNIHRRHLLKGQPARAGGCPARHPSRRGKRIFSRCVN